MGGAVLTSEQMRAARALLRWEQKDLAAASKVSLPSIKRLERLTGPLAAQPLTIDALRKAFETGGVIFIDENGEGPGVRLKKRNGAAA
jgi:transcriptional regulator with XRE-family HTH domain